MIKFQVFRGVGGRGMPGMPHNFDCKATDRLRGICSSCKDFTHGVTVVILDGASIVQMLKVVGVSIAQ